MLQPGFVRTGHDHEANSPETVQRSLCGLGPYACRDHFAM